MSTNREVSRLNDEVEALLARAAFAERELADARHGIRSLLNYAKFRGDDYIEEGWDARVKQIFDAARATD